jgi:hypothetical protein
LLVGLFDNKKTEEQKRVAEAANQAMDQANKALQGVTESFRTFTAVASGPVTSSIKDAQRQFNSLQQSAKSAIDAATVVVNTAGNTAAQMAAANAAMDNARKATADATQQLAEYYERTIAAGRESLRGTEQLTTIGQAMKDLTDKAKDLNEAMILAGTSAEEAAAAVGEDLAEGMRKLRVSIETDLARKINDIVDKGWINELGDLFAEVADAKKAGVNAQLLGDYLAKAAQKIVDSAELSGAAFDELIRTFPELSGTVHEFSVSAQLAADEVEKAAEQIVRTVQEINEAALSLHDRLFEANIVGFGQGNTMAGALARFDRSAQAQREAEIKAGGENIVLLEQTLAQERLNVIEDFNNQALRKSEALQDRLLSAQTDTNTLEGRLAILDRQQQREREEAARQGGTDMVLLEQTLAAERMRVVEDFNDQLVEAEKQAAEDRIKATNDAAKSIVDYVSGLFTGSQAGASPVNRLTAATEVYQKTLALAQAGNIDAVNRLASDAEVYRTALRDVYGSTQKYQEGVKQISTDLLSLPTVQSSTDQIVNAIRDSIIVLQQIEAALGSSTVPADIADILSSMGIDAYKLPPSFLAAQNDNLPELLQEIRSMRTENAFMLTQIAQLTEAGNESNVTAITEQQQAYIDELRRQADRAGALQAVNG